VFQADWDFVLAALHPVGLFLVCARQIETYSVELSAILVRRIIPFSASAL